MRKRIGLIILSLIAAAGRSPRPFRLPALCPERKWIASYAFQFAQGQVADNAGVGLDNHQLASTLCLCAQQFYRVGILQLLLALLVFLLDSTHVGVAILARS